MKQVCLPVLAIFILFSTTSFNSIDTGSQLVGVWESEEKNLQIEMYETNGEYFGRMIYFKCSTEEIMKTSKDIENPDKALTGRHLLGMTLVTRLAYQGNNVWDDGEIYDPNSGRTFEARIQLTGSHSAIVRGYWKFKWIGRSMVFRRKL